MLEVTPNAFQGEFGTSRFNRGNKSPGLKGQAAYRLVSETSITVSKGTPETVVAFFSPFFISVAKPDNQEHLKTQATILNLPHSTTLAKDEYHTLVPELQFLTEKRYNSAYGVVVCV